MAVPYDGMMVHRAHPIRRPDSPVAAGRVILVDDSEHALIVLLRIREARPPIDGFRVGNIIRDRYMIADDSWLFPNF